MRVPYQPDLYLNIPFWFSFSYIENLKVSPLVNGPSHIVDVAAGNTTLLSESSRKSPSRAFTQLCPRAHHSWWFAWDDLRQSRSWACLESSEKLVIDDSLMHCQSWRALPDCYIKLPYSIIGQVRLDRDSIMPIIIIDIIGDVFRWNDRRINGHTKGRRHNKLFVYAFGADD